MGQWQEQLGKALWVNGKSSLVRLYGAMARGVQTMLTFCKTKIIITFKKKFCPLGLGLGPGLGLGLGQLFLLFSPHDTMHLFVIIIIIIILRVSLCFTRFIRVFNEALILEQMNYICPSITSS